MLVGNPNLSFNYNRFQTAQPAHRVLLHCSLRSFNFVPHGCVNWIHDGLVKDTLVMDILVTRRFGS